MSEVYNVVTPIELDGGKTVWHKVGVAFPNKDPTKNHVMTISILSMPIKNINSDLKLFIYPQQKYGKSPPDFQPPPIDNNVPF